MDFIRRLFKKRDVAAAASLATIGTAARSSALRGDTSPADPKLRALLVASQGRHPKTPPDCALSYERAMGVALPACPISWEQNDSARQSPCLVCDAILRQPGETIREAPTQEGLASECTLTPEEEREFQLQQYKSRVPVYFAGTTPSRQANAVELGGKFVALGDREMALLLRLAVALRRDPQGYAFKGDPIVGGGLVKEGYLTPDGIAQAIARLRKTLQPVLQPLAATDFIETRRTKHVRLSTHINLVRVDPRLTQHADPQIAGLALELTSPPAGTR